MRTEVFQHLFFGENETEQTAEPFFQTSDAETVRPKSSFGIVADPGEVGSGSFLPIETTHHTSALLSNSDVKAPALNRREVPGATIHAPQHQQRVIRSFVAAVFISASSPPDRRPGR